MQARSDANDFDLLRHHRPNVLARVQSAPCSCVWYQGSEALLAIQTGEIIAGSLPKVVTRVMRDWIADHQDELIANWARGQRREAFEQVPGADIE